jgi:predicted TPR repeat methyltransferase
MASDGIVSNSTQLSVTLQAQQLYDDWNNDYDQQLLGQCEYRSPARLAQLLTELAVTMRFDWMDRPWLDLGAGTGLVGRALFAAGQQIPLIAVDTSRAMLSRIDHEPYVACAELDVLAGPTLAGPALAALGTHGAIALGLTEHVLDLRSLFAACAHALDPGSPLVFSYCPLPDTSDLPWQVFESFSTLVAHQPLHVSSALTANGFTQIAMREGPGYRTAGLDVAHHLVVARRSNGP